MQPSTADGKFIDKLAFKRMPSTFWPLDIIGKEKDKPAAVKSNIQQVAQISPLGQRMRTNSVSMQQN